VVAWAASNGDRSENADYQYGKRRLRQIDGRIRFLTKRIAGAEVVDSEAPRTGQAATRAFLGAIRKLFQRGGPLHSKLRCYNLVPRGNPWETCLEWYGI
jgi:hypothetical protein